MSDGWKVLEPLRAAEKAADAARSAEVIVNGIKADQLDRAADVIVDRFMPMCVCEVHGGYEVRDVVRRIAKTLTAEADRLRAEA